MKYTESHLEEAVLEWFRKKKIETKIVEEYRGNEKIY
jgi:hypothetical protein